MVIIRLEMLIVRLEMGMVELRYPLRRTMLIIVLGIKRKEYQDLLPRDSDDWPMHDHRSW